MNDKFVFPGAALAFLGGLEENNNKAWFDAHKTDYQENVLEPLKVLVSGLGVVMSKKLPGLHYDPRVNGSIFRIYRDTRFSKDKRPYKTHASAFLWVGAGPKLACPGIYFHLEAKTVLLGAGAYALARESIDPYRKYVAGKGGGRIAKALAKAEKAGFTTGGDSLKRVPPGFPTDHKHAQLLKMKGLYVTKTLKASKVTRGDLLSWLKGEYEPAVNLVKELNRYYA